MRLRLFIALLMPAAIAAADRLPDMRWIFERAARLDARSDVHRFDRVRAWALVPLLYPDDEPGTENDEVWRLVARSALTRLDASAAGYPPPLPPLPLHLPAPDPVGELLGAQLAAEPLGGVRVRAASASSGLAVGDRILACDGFTVHDPDEAAQRIAEAGSRGRLRLGLDGGEEIELLIGSGRPAPLLAALRLHGVAQPWEPPRRWRLPALDGLWLLTGTGTVEVDGRSPRAPPEAPAWTALAAGGTAIVARGTHDLRATPLRGAWRPASERLILGVRAGQALVVETAGPAHLLSVSDPGGGLWSEPAVATAHRLARHGPAGVLASDAIERNGMAVISVRPMDGVRLRILSETDAGDFRP